MKVKRDIRYIILLTALFVVAVGVGVATSPSTSISWHDYNDAMKLAEEEDKPMMINFGADWCRFCGKLDEKTFTDGQVIALSESFVCIKVDVDQGERDQQKNLNKAHSHHNLR
jgi:Highly conserved protein containing a thioredoxin domain